MCGYDHEELNREAKEMAMRSLEEAIKADEKLRASGELQKIMARTVLPYKGRDYKKK